MVFPKGLNEVQGMEEDEYMVKHNYHQETIVS